jgi:hypothetical protein
MAQYRPLVIIGGQLRELPIGEQIAGAVSISDTPPYSPSPTEFWWDSAAGVLRLRYDDGDSAQWVDAVPIPPVDVPLRNRWVNGSLQVSQENGNNSGTSDAFFVADQLSVHRVTSAGVITVQRVQSPTPGGASDRARITITTADASLAAGEYLFLRTLIEGSDVADLRWGTADAQPVLLRFLFKGPAGTYAVRVTNAANDRSYVALFSPTAANVDEIIEISVPGDTTGTWTTSAGSTGMEVCVVLACGSTFQGAAGWQAGDILGTSAVSNGMGTGSAVFEFGEFGYYRDYGPRIRPLWQLSDLGDELRRCKRFYQLARGTNRDNGAAANTKSYTSPVNFGVEMRAAPSVSFTAITSTLVSSRSALNVTAYGLTYQTIASGGPSMFDECTIVLNARLTAG